MLEAVHAFLLGFPALFSIVNPISGALIFRGVTASRSAEARATLARLVALNSGRPILIAIGRRQGRPYCGGDRRTFAVAELQPA